MATFKPGQRVKYVGSGQLHGEPATFVRYENFPRWRMAPDVYTGHISVSSAQMDCVITFDSRPDECVTASKYLEPITSVKPKEKSREEVVPWDEMAGLWQPEHLRQKEEA